MNHDSHRSGEQTAETGTGRRPRPAAAAADGDGAGGPHAALDLHCQQHGRRRQRRHPALGDRPGEREQSGDDTIVFSSLFDTPQTITLTGGQLALTGTTATHDHGPGANLLTVSGDGTSGVFVIDGASATISGLTIAGGAAAIGGGVRDDGGTLTLSTVVRQRQCRDGPRRRHRHPDSAARTDPGRLPGQRQYRRSTKAPACSTRAATLSTDQRDTSPATPLIERAAAAASPRTTAATTLINATVTANTAGYGRRTVGRRAASATLTNTIVAGNTGGDVSGTISGGNNVIGGDPKLAPLGDYGGPTSDHGPAAGQPGDRRRHGHRGPGDRPAGPAARRPASTSAPSRPRSSSRSTLTLDGVGSAPGQISLRQAVNLANALASEDAIIFSTRFFATPQTITLTGGPLELTDKATTTIVGPGANLLTLSGNKAGRVFELSGGSAAIQGLTITGGVAAAGGGVRNDGGTLVMTDAVINGNQATTGNGGGLLATSGTTTLNDVTFSGNTASGNGVGSGGTGGRGGALATSGNATITGCTLTGNTAVYGGGAANSMAVSP